MGDDCDLGLGLAIGGCEFKQYFKHESKQFPGKHNILFPPRMNEKIRDVEVEITSKRGADIKKRPKVEDDSVAKDLSNSVENESSSGIIRKKLRLTTEQSSLLEDSFRTHQILSSKQKKELARQLNLKPRQVEVWFQNRRARTKLKQTEVDCELLKRLCESLTCENKRLKGELMELRLIKARASSLNCQNLQGSKVINVCPSCEKIG